MPVLGRLQRRSSSALDRSPAPAWPLVVPPRVVRGPSWLEALAPEAPEKPPHQAPPRGPGHHGRPEGRELRAAWHLRAGPARPAAGLRRPSGQQRPRRGRRRGARGGGAPWRRHGAGARHARQLRPSPRQRRRGRRAAGADRGARARGNRGRGHPRRRQGQDQEPEQGGADPREAPVQRRVRDVPRRRRHPHQPERGPGHRGAVRRLPTAQHHRQPRGLHQRPDDLRRPQGHLRGAPIDHRRRPVAEDAIHEAAGPVRHLRLHPVPELRHPREVGWRQAVLLSAPCAP
ncbi:unnamed protein product [Prorocentrum cordatum]|uniref:Uncharacterized protein n=1 Tax=Prorocentrum cordatum TaxID=2364126 RepID=A0ABN9SP73_9DINO|nr:unnamed protein product [Polarella glacialis]